MGEKIKNREKKIYIENFSFIYLVKKIIIIFIYLLGGQI